MEKVTVYNQAGEKVKEVALNPKVFGVVVKPDVVSNAIIVQQANSRQVLAHAKDRSDVSGGGRKPWRQKGTGRARHGSIRSPLWRGGGVTFGPTSERNFSLKINRKEKRKALLMGLSDKAAHSRIVLLDALTLSESKTKQVYTILQNLKLRPLSAKKTKVAKVETEDASVAKKKGNPPRVLVILPQKDEKIYKALRNITRVDLILANSLNIADVVKAHYLVMPEASIPVIEKTFVK